VKYGAPTSVRNLPVTYCCRTPVTTLHTFNKNITYLTEVSSAKFLQIVKSDNNCYDRLFISLVFNLSKSLKYYILESQHSKVLNKSLGKYCNEKLSTTNKNYKLLIEMTSLKSTVMAALGLTPSHK
jgi:hypothetical protein